MNNSVKIKWNGSGDAPKTVNGAGFSVKPYEVKGGQASIDERDLYTILNRNQGEWEIANVSSTRPSKKDEPDTGSAGNDTE